MEQDIQYTKELSDAYLMKSKEFAEGGNKDKAISCLNKSIFLSTLLVYKQKLLEEL